MNYSDDNNESNFIFEFWDLLLNYKYSILMTVITTTLIGLFYAVSAEPLYRAQVLMTESDNQTSGGGMGAIAEQIGGIAGLDIGGQGKSVDTYLAILKSRSFIENFIQESDSKKFIFANSWNNESGEWIEEEPSDFKAYYAFQEHILSVSKNVKTGVLTLSIVWHDPVRAADWANNLVKNLNNILRIQAIDEATKRITFLEEQTKKTSLIGLQSLISALIQSQYEKAMIANVKEEYGFKIIDPARIPEVKFSPNRTLILILSFVSGIFIGILLALFMNIMAHYKRYKAST